MTLGDIINLFRAEVDDEVEPFLWSDTRAIEFANDAQNEACRRSRLILDSTTAEITQIAIETDTASYALDPRVLFVRKVRLANSRPMLRMNMQDMECRDPFWEDAAASTPVIFIMDHETGKIKLHPTPNADGTLLMTVVRDPLAEMNAQDDVPEIAARYHRSLRYWMAFRAYSMQDSESNDPKKAVDSLTLFEQEFGKKSAAIDENWIEREQMLGDGTY